MPTIIKNLANFQSKQNLSTTFVLILFSIELFRWGWETAQIGMRDTKLFIIINPN